MGRRIAEYLNMNVVGMLGVVSKAKALSLIDSFQECRAYDATPRHLL